MPSAETRREHSPDYPAIGLKEAIDRLSRLHKAIQRHAAPRELVAKGLGYNSLNGASMSAIAALRKFGLLAKKGDTLRVSDKGTQILYPRSDEERARALVEAALVPPLFSEMHNEFEWNVPSDDLIINYLIRKGFLQRSATVALAAFKETAALIESIGADLNLTATPIEEGNEERYQASTTQTQERELVLPKISSDPEIQPQITSSLEAARQKAFSQSERRLFSYDFEDGGGLDIIMRGTVDTLTALDIAATWIEVKRREIERKPTKKNTPPAAPGNDTDNSL